MDEKMMENFVGDYRMLMAGIDIFNAARTNDMELALDVSARLNAIELDESDTAYITERVLQCMSIDNIEAADVVHAIIDNINIITDKVMMHHSWEMTCMRQKSPAEQETYLESLDVDTIVVSDHGYSLSCVRDLLNMCQSTKRFDIMDMIRSKIAEVV